MGPEPIVEVADDEPFNEFDGHRCPHGIEAGHFDFVGEVRLPAASLLAPNRSPQPQQYL